MNLYAIASELKSLVTYRKLRYYLGRGMYRMDSAEEFAALISTGIDPSKAGAMADDLAETGEIDRHVSLGGRKYVLTVKVDV
jgi:hypothetical protein